MDNDFNQWLEELKIKNNQQHATLATTNAIRVARNRRSSNRVVHRGT